jgi:acetyl esterase
MMLQAATVKTTKSEGQPMKDDVRETTIEITEVAYREFDGLKLLAQIYRPPGKGPFPAVVEVHGGAWTGGDRFNNDLIARKLAADGIVVMAIEFRMPPDFVYPASVADINFAIRWLKLHAEAYGIDTRAIGGLGTSSGGHQLLLAALCPGDSKYNSPDLPLEKANGGELRFAALGWPISDPLARYQMANERGNTRLVQSHDAYFGSRETMAAANPQLIVERREFSHLPPLLVLQGTADENVTPDMADRFAAAYRAAGGDVELYKFEGQPHAFATQKAGSPESQLAIDRFADFIHRHSR